MSADPLRAIADAVLYEGYILWPYRRSALKNQQRFTFGGVYPPAHCARHPDDPSLMQAEVLLRGGEPTAIEVVVRFLHVVERTAARRTARGLEPVDELIVGDRRELSWEEAVERQLSARGPGSVPFTVAAGETVEPIGDAGALIRRWDGLEGTLELSATPLGRGLVRVRVRILNATPFAGASRAEALRRTLCSTHALLTASNGAFVSLTDPPPELAGAAGACANIGCWPVLVGAPGETRRMLCSPIILEDHPRIAPESPGDLFDGGEIDQLLVLNILALTDAEKAEMAASDPRAREILERTKGLTPEQLMRLHGAVREFGLARS